MKKSDVLVYGLVLIAVVLLFNFGDSPFVEKFGKISTLLLTVLTAGYVLLTHWILRSNRESTQEQTRPYIVASLPLDGFEVVLSIKNVGSRPARDVKTEFQPSLDTISPDFPLKGRPLLIQPFMAPSFEVRNPIALTPDVLKFAKEQKIFRVAVSYQDAHGEKYAEEYKIDLNSYVYDKSVVQHSFEHYLELIANSLKKLAEKR